MVLNFTRIRTLNLRHRRHFFFTKIDNKFAFIEEDLRAGKANVAIYGALLTSVVFK
jgi:hypothetical protein